MSTVDINSLTIGQLRELAPLVHTFFPQASAAVPATLANPSAQSLVSELTGTLVIVRTYSAGVHIGVLYSLNGTQAELKDARRLWRWEGAFSLNEVASAGVGKGSRISARVPYILLTEAIEVIPVNASQDVRDTLEPSE